MGTSCYGSFLVGDVKTRTNRKVAVNRQGPAEVAWPARATWSEAELNTDTCQSAAGRKFTVTSLNPAHTRVVIGTPSLASGWSADLS